MEEEPEPPIESTAAIEVADEIAEQQARLQQEQDRLRSVLKTDDKAMVAYLNAAALKGPAAFTVAVKYVQQARNY